MNIEQILNIWASTNSLQREFLPAIINEMANIKHIELKNCDINAIIHVLMSVPIDWITVMTQIANYHNKEVITVVSPQKQIIHHILQ